MAPSRTCLTLAVLTLTCASCGSSGDGDVLRAGSHYVIVGADGDLDNVAGFGLPSGRVELVGDCLGIDGRTVIWPHGTEIVSTDPLEVDVPDFGKLSEGDEFSEAGAEDWSADRLPDGIDALPSGCPGENLIALVP
jgi:hypothetical protein